MILKNVFFLKTLWKTLCLKCHLKIDSKIKLVDFVSKVSEIKNVYLTNIVVLKVLESKKKIEDEDTINLLLGIYCNTCKAGEIQGTTQG